jgi:ankyrin repeat protein
VDPRGDPEWTPLISAASFGDVEMFEVLLDYEADIEARSITGRTALHFTARSHRFGVPKVVRLLLEHGADINTRDA